MEISNQTIDQYLATVEFKRLDDIKFLIEIGKKLTNKDPQIWGSIVGFGKLHYRYKSGHEGDMPLFSFANRKEAITIYFGFDLSGFDQIQKLGKYRVGKGCLYVKHLSDIDTDLLVSMIKDSINQLLHYDFIQVMD